MHKSLVQFRTIRELDVGRCIATSFVVPVSTSALRTSDMHEVQKGRTERDESHWRDTVLNGSLFAQGTRPSFRASEVNTAHARFDDLIAENKEATTPRH
jgi:hypothetical protein